MVSKLIDVVKITHSHFIGSSENSSLKICSTDML